MMERPKDILTQELCQRFITLPGERLIIAKRQHWFILAAPLLLTILVALLVGTLSGALFLTDNAPGLFVISLFLILSASVNIATKLVADWYYHLYIVTTKRILEVSCAPLFSHSINDVALDQVRITEIDVRIKGFLNELMDIGDVIIEFDRPSHEEVFVIPNVKDPSNAGTLLANTVKLMMQSSPVWFQPRKQEELYKFTEDVSHHDDSPQRLHS